MSFTQKLRSALAGVISLSALMVGCSSSPKQAQAAAETNDLKAAPNFSLTDAKGATVTLSDYKGKVVLLNFWATWCGPCKIEIPWFIEFERIYKDRGFAVLGVSLDEEGWQVVKPYVEQQKVNYRIVVGNDQVAQLYGGIDALPMTFLINQDGKIAAKHIGLTSKKSYEDDILELLGPLRPAGAGRRTSPEVFPVAARIVQDWVKDPRQSSIKDEVQEPIKDAVYAYPMDPDVRSNGPGFCPRCGMKLVAGIPDPVEYHMDLAVTPRAPRVEQTARLDFAVHDPWKDRPVTKFVEVHEKLFHMFVISQDLQFFAHEHPTLEPHGNFHYEIAFPKPGMYRVLGDFYPDGATPQLITKTVFVPGAAPAPVALERDYTTKEAQNMEVELVTDPPEPHRWHESVAVFSRKAWRRARKISWSLGSHVGSER